MKHSGRVKILLADDHALYREGISHILDALEGDVTIIEACDYAEAFQVASQHDDFDLALVDLVMPGMEPGEDRFDGLRTLRAELADVPIVVISANDDRKHVMKAVECGAVGYIPKTLDSKVVLGAIRLVFAGGMYLPPTVLDEHHEETIRTLAATEDQTDPSSSRLRLTPRQMDVLFSLVQGKSNKEIARELNLAEPTIKLHVTALLKGLQVNNRTQAAVKAARLGIISIDSAGP
jgi:DNA-binding NarL/FixJ family response regulator